jgi:hypothetical protein
MSTHPIHLNIPLSFDQLVQIVQQLSPKDKIKLHEVLLETLNTEDFEIPEEHKKIVRQRIEASKSDPSRRLRWEEAKLKLKV